MPIMEATWYLPEEELQYRNYPEVHGVMDNINRLVYYAMSLSIVLDDYNNAVADRIDIDVVDLQKNITLCRSITDVLGNAPQVCFDLLMELRTIQDTMQTLLYAYNRFGSQYIGKPTDLTEDSDPNII